ncbi:MAG: hypothetical protein AB1538_00580 [Bacillota bacterium]
MIGIILFIEEMGIVLDNLNRDAPTITCGPNIKSGVTIGSTISPKGSYHGIILNLDVQMNSVVMIANSSRTFNNKNLQAF